MDHYQGIEQLRGVGRLWRNGAVVADDVHYAVDVQQKMLDAGRGEFVPGLQRITGSIHSDFSTLTTLVFEGGELELEMEDGRSWGCLLTSNNGTLVNRDGIKPPKS